MVVARIRLSHQLWASTTKVTHQSSLGEATYGSNGKCKSKSNHQRFFPRPPPPFRSHVSVLLSFFPYPSQPGFAANLSQKPAGEDSLRRWKRERERERGQTTSWITFSHRGSFSLASHLSSVSFQRGWVFRPFAPLFIGTWNKSKESHFFKGICECGEELNGRKHLSSIFYLLGSPSADHRAFLSLSWKKNPLFHFTMETRRRENGKKLCEGKS